MKTIVFATGVEHADALADTFNRNGVPANSVHSGRMKKENDEILKAFENNEFVVLVSIMMLSTGFDMPDIECGISCRPTNTYRTYIQQVGRIARIHEGKKEALWLDFAQNTRIHGLYDEPYQLIPASDKEALDKMKESRRVDNIDTYLTDKGLENFELNVSRVKEHMVEKKKAAMHTGCVTDLISLFDTSMNIDEIAEYGLRIDSLVNGTKHRKDTKEWITETWHKALADFPSNNNRWTKAFRTMMKNKIKSGKKVVAVRFAIDWLLEQDVNQL